MKIQMMKSEETKNLVFPNGQEINFSFDHVFLWYGKMYLPREVISYAAFKNSHPHDARTLAPNSLVFADDGTSIDRSTQTALLFNPKIDRKALYCEVISKKNYVVRQDRAELNKGLRKLRRIEKVLNKRKEREEGKAEVEIETDGERKSPPLEQPQRQIKKVKNKLEGYEKFRVQELPKVQPQPQPQVQSQEPEVLMLMKAYVENSQKLAEYKEARKLIDDLILKQEVLVQQLSAQLLNLAAQECAHDTLATAHEAGVDEATAHEAGVDEATAHEAGADEAMAFMADPIFPEMTVEEIQMMSFEACETVSKFYPHAGLFGEQAHTTTMQSYGQEVEKDIQKTVTPPFSWYR